MILELVRLMELKTILTFLYERIFSLIVILWYILKLIRIWTARIEREFTLFFIEIAWVLPDWANRSESWSRSPPCRCCWANLPPPYNTRTIWPACWSRLTSQGFFSFLWYDLLWGKSVSLRRYVLVFRFVWWNYPL